MQIKNLDKAAKRILKAIKKRENIVIFGDADLDGVASAIIVKESINSLGGKISEIYFPDREKEGYGISFSALKFLEKEAPAVFIALDCGIGNFKEVKMAKRMGFKMIIVDHHEILDCLPEAEIIVDPKQKSDKYNFKQFATAGLAFKLAESLFKNKMPESLRKSLLELAALATISDMMPRTDDNAVIIADGLNSIKSSWRPGIQALLGNKELISLDFMQKIYKINSLMNIRDIENRMPAAFRVLASSDRRNAEKLAERLFLKGIEKQKRVKTIMEEVEAKIMGKNADSIIFEGKSDWELALIGVVASILTQKYQKPIFLYKGNGEESQGGARAPSGLNLVEAMKGYSKKLITYGGHPQAAGFRIKDSELEGFKKHLTDYFKNQ